MIEFFLSMFARRIPMLLIVLLGIVVAIARWKRHPRASLITVLALALYLFEDFFVLMLRYAMPSLANAVQIPPNAIRTVFTVIGLLDYLSLAIVTVLLVGAAFTGRKAADRPPSPSQAQELAA